MKVPVGISMRHVHLTESIYWQLFDEELQVVRPLNQIGEFASDKFVTLKTAKNTLEKVRIVGPFRQYNQVEISKTDSYTLGINPPVRMSGNVEDSLGIVLMTEKGMIELDQGVIIAQRHVHLSASNTKGFKDNQLVLIKVDSLKGGYMQALTKISDNGYFELHIDTDDANSFLLENDAEVEIVKEI